MCNFRLKGSKKIRHETFGAFVLALKVFHKNIKNTRYLKSNSFLAPLRIPNKFHLDDKTGYKITIILLFVKLPNTNTKRLKNLNVFLLNKNVPQLYLVRNFHINILTHAYRF